MASESGDAVGVVGVASGDVDAAALIEGGAGLGEVIFGGGGYLVQRGRVAYHPANFLGERAQKDGAEKEFAVLAACEVAYLVP